MNNLTALSLDQSAVSKSSRLTFIPFNQGTDLIKKLNHGHRELLGFCTRYGGLCQLICNRVLIDDLLGRGQDRRFLRDHVTVEKISEKAIVNSHIMRVFSPFSKIGAYFFRIYPSNVFSYHNQLKLVDQNHRVNRHVLAQGLDDIEKGETLKLEVFSRSGVKFSGHSTLMKKTHDNEFIFFEPNEGEHRHLSLERLADRIDYTLLCHKGTDILLMRGKDYLRKLEAKGLLSAS